MKGIYLWLVFNKFLFNVFLIFLKEMGCLVLKVFVRVLNGFLIRVVVELVF